MKIKARWREGALGQPCLEGGALLTHRQLEIVEQLVELDPVGSYARRGAAKVAELAGFTGFRLEVGEEIHQSEPSPGGVAAHSVTLSVGSETLGILHLHGEVTSEGRQLADWAARVFAKGLDRARRLDGRNWKRTYEDVQAMLERTPLTPRERDVVGRLLSGASTRQIAESTGLTVATVNTYLKRIFAKLGVHSRVELVARVTGTRGVIPSGPAKAKTRSP